MATFAPELPNTNTPDWTKIYKPVEQPEADKSKGIALQTIGQGISEGATLAENTFESYMKDKIRAGVDTLREGTTAAYENIRNAQVTGQKPDPRAVQTAGFDGSLVNQNTDIPEALQAGLDRASNLALAKAQGKANDTLYTGALNSMAKQLRAQYPGHVDFIDEQIAKISGINPANAYMQNLLTDINRNGLKENTFEKQIMTMAKEYFGNPDVYKYWTAYQHGLPGSFENLTSAVQRAAARDYNNQQKKTDRDLLRGDQADAADLASRDQVGHVMERAQENFDPIVKIPGLSSPQRISQIVSAAQEGKVQITGPQWDQLSQAVSASRRHLEDQMNEDDIKYGYGKTINDPKRIRDNHQLALNWWDSLQDAITNKDIGAMGAIKRRNELSVSDTRHQAYDSPIGNWLKNRKVLSEDLAGSPWMQTIDQLTLTKGSQLKDLENFFGDASRAAISSPDLRTDTGVKSLTDSLNAAKQAKDKGFNVPDQAYKDLVGNVELITQASKSSDPKSREVAKHVVDYMFGPRNDKLMEFWGNDSRDKDGYRLGKEGIFKMMTRPEMSDSIWNLRDPTSWQQYKDAQETWFKTIFQGHVGMLNAAMSSRIFPGSLSWDSDNHKFCLTQTDPNKSIRGLQNSVAKINEGLKNISYMHDKEGTDTNEHMMGLLMDMGYSPNDKLHGDNLPQRAIQAIAASSKSNAQRLEEAFKAARSKKEE